MDSLVVALKDLRQRARDRSAYIVGIVAPLVLGLVISISVGGAEESFSTSVAVADLDGGSLARTFTGQVLTDPELAEILSVRTVASPAEAERLVGDDDVAAAIVIPAGFSAAASAGRSPELLVLRGAGSPIGADVVEAVATGFVSRVDAIALATETARADGATGDPAALAAAAAAAEPAVLAEPVEASRRGPPPSSRFFPAMGILFLFFTVGLGARSVVTERQQGTMARLLVAPVTPRRLLVGKALATFVLGIVSLTVLAVVSTLVAGADWGPPAAAAALILAITFAAMGIVGLLLTFAETERQANGYTSIAAFGLALLGGNFVTLARAPELLQRLALVTPNGWALRAWDDLAAQGGGLGSVLPALGAILAFGAVTMGLALARADRLVRL